MGNVLKVDRKKLMDGLKMARKFLKPKPEGAAFLSFEADKLIIDFRTFTISADAEGDWSGQAEIPANFFVANVPPSLPGDGPVEVRIEGSQLHFNGWIIPCLLRDVAERPIQLAMDTPLWAILALRLKHTDEQLRTSSLSDIISRAEHERDKRIAEAAAALEPFGIDASHLRLLVDEQLKKAKL